MESKLITTQHHSLNGSSGSVNGDLPMGIGKFQPPTKSIPLNQSTKKFGTVELSWLRPRGDPVYQIWYKSTHWGLLGKWV